MRTISIGDIAVGERFGADLDPWAAPARKRGFWLLCGQMSVRCHYAPRREIQTYKSHAWLETLPDGHIVVELPSGKDFQCESLRDAKRAAASAFNFYMLRLAAR